MQSHRLGAVLVAAAAASLAGCVVVHGSSVAGPDRPMPPSIVPHTPARDTAESRRITKRVADKEPPYTLIAQDASRCAVSETEYRGIHVGDVIACEWIAPAVKPPADGLLLEGLRGRGR